jgi:hypothetical protein
MLLDVRIGDVSNEIEIWILLHCEIFKSLSVLFQDVGEGLYDKRVGNYDVMFEIRDVDAIHNVLEHV